MCGVAEAFSAEHVSQNGGGRGRLHRMARRIARKRRRGNIRPPLAVYVIVDVGHRPLEIVHVLGVPAADKRVVHGNADAREGFGRPHQR